ncbi:xanthine dehydrogenase family protein subunit M [Ruegeria sp. EL01]|uniref:FAD binding domain-containing protein n=1 Tax=Ruegeria sp. EL01 TaxID=2107578 RepID=UPI000EA7F9E2|nr:FAD binding domain-containing protein [Ruegeria sp. EL01]
MKSSFTYQRATTPIEAVAMLAQKGAGAKIWAGGTDMTLHWQQEKTKPTVCIDIRDLKELDYIKVERDAIRIGALTSLATLERSADQHHVLASLSKITKLMATPQTRTLATVGGNLCNASPAADLSPAFVALGATAMILGESGSREVAMFDFFQGVNKTALNGAEILEEVTIPLPSDGEIHVSYRRIDRTVVDIALVNGSAAVSVGSDGVISKVGVGLGAVAPIILDASDASAELEGTALADVTVGKLAAVAATAAKHAKPISDIRASAGYRQDMVEIMLRRALEDTIKNHGGTI